MIVARSAARLAGHDAGRVAEIAARRAVRHDHPSWPIQRALLTMLQEGYVTGWSARPAGRTAERSERMRSVLERHGELTGDPAGMYLTVALDGAHASAVAERALVLGIEVPLLADYCRTAQRDRLGGRLRGSDGPGVRARPRRPAARAGVDNRQTLTRAGAESVPLWLEQASETCHNRGAAS